MKTKHFLIICLIYSFAFIFDIILSFGAVSGNLAKGELLISAMFTFFIVFAPAYIFNTFFLNLKKNRASATSIFSIIGLIFASIFSLISIWGTFETLHNITFRNFIPNYVKTEFQEDLKVFKSREASLTHSIEKTRDKILSLDPKYITVRKSYENILANFNKELQILGEQKPSLEKQQQTRTLAIVGFFSSIGISLNGRTFLELLLILSAFGLEVFLIILSYNLSSFFINREEDEKNKNQKIEDSKSTKKVEKKDKDITQNIRFIKNNYEKDEKISTKELEKEDNIKEQEVENINPEIAQNIKFIKNNLENDKKTIKPRREIMKNTSISERQLKNILVGLKNENLVIKNGGRLLLNY